MTGKEVADTVMRFLEILISWPIIFFVVVLLVRRQLPDLIQQLAARITKAPGGFEFAMTEVKDQLKAVEKKVDRLADSVNFLPSTGLTDDLRKRLEAALAEFLVYLHGVGFPSVDRPAQVYVDPGLGRQAHVKNNRLVLGAEIADNVDVALHEFAHHVLATDKPPHKKWGKVYQQVEAGFADYLPCSFKGSSAFGSTAGRRAKRPLRDLANDGSLEGKRDDPGHAVGLIWGGAFWDIRELLGEERADRLLCSAWIDLGPEDIEAHEPSAFLDRLTAPADLAEHVSALESIFDRRGLRGDRE